jgi:hypothetical protein
MAKNIGLLYHNMIIHQMVIGVSFDGLSYQCQGNKDSKKFMFFFESLFPWHWFLYCGTPTWSHI